MPLFALAANYTAKQIASKILAKTATVTVATVAAHNINKAIKEKNAKVNGNTTALVNGACSGIGAGVFVVLNDLINDMK